MNVLWIIFLCVWTLNSSLSFAQTQSIGGEIYFKDGTSPAARIKVVLKSQSTLITITDENGKFDLTIPDSIKLKYPTELILIPPKYITNDQINVRLKNNQVLHKITLPFSKPVIAKDLTTSLDIEKSNNTSKISQNESNKDSSNTQNNVTIIEADSLGLASLITKEEKERQTENKTNKTSEERNRTNPKDTFSLKSYQLEFKRLTEKIRIEKDLLQKNDKEIKQGLSNLLRQLSQSKEIKPEERDSLKKYVLALEEYLDEYADAFEASQKELREALQEVKNILFEQEYRIRRSRITIITLLGVILGLALLSYVFFQVNKRIRKQREELAYRVDKINKQKEEIEQQKAQIIEQNQDLAEKSEALKQAYNQITDSLVYAERIQQAFLGNSIKLEQSFPESLVFLKPRDIVSGDFYWLHQAEHLQILAVIDCTGHGVPGAFMTILAHDILNLIVKEKQITDPAEILSQLDQQLQQALKKEQGQQSAKYGMDLMIFVLDGKQGMAHLAGSRSYLCYVKNQEIHTFKGDTHFIGSTATKEQKRFNTQTLALEGDEVFYLFTDGFQDQFGGEEDSKYLKSRFIGLLHSISSKPFQQQIEILEHEFINWKKDEPQTDDVLIIGIKP